MNTRRIGAADLAIHETSPELAEVKISYSSPRTSKAKIISSRDAYDVLFALFDKQTIEYQEQFYLLLLNRANYLIGWIKLSHGGTTGTIADPKVIFTLGLKTNASSIILCHNHPSGNLNPSETDIKMTRTLREAGILLELAILDHLIIVPDGRYYSFVDEGVF